MSGANIGTAYMTVSPKFENLGKSVNDALGKADPEASGAKLGAGVSAGFERGVGGIATSGALIGAFSAITTKAMDMISSSVSSAASRLDTLNNYPRIMQALGYSAEDAQSSITKMSDHITGLPTALNDMASTVQGLSAITGNLNEATDAGLALNDMLLASGSNTQLVNAASEQFRQILAKGKPDLQDWKSLTQTMPGQMKQLAQAMLGPTANANDLFYALGGGKHQATISMDQLMAKMVEMDTVSTDGFTSFESQARAATGGVQNSFANMQIAITRGMTNVMNSIGTDTISRVLSDVGKSFENGLKVISSKIESVKPDIDKVVSFAEDEMPKVGSSIVAAFDSTISVVSTGISSVSGLAKQAEPAVSGLASAFASIAPESGGAITAVLALGLAGKGLNSLSGFVQTGGMLGGIAKSAGASFGVLAGKMTEGSKAANLLSGLSSSLGGSMGGPMVLGAGLAAAGIGYLVTKLIDAKNYSDSFTKSTSGLKDAVNNISSPIQSLSDAYDKIASPSNVKSYDEITDAVNRQIDAQSKLADKINSRHEDTNTSVGLLETYKQTIDDLANKSGQSADEQGRLKVAIDGMNTSCGTQYQIVDAVNGKIADQSGAIQTTTGAIDGYISKLQQQYRVEALKQDYIDLYKQQQSSFETLQDAQDAYNSAKEKEAKSTGSAKKQLNDYNPELALLKTKLDESSAAYSSVSDQVDALSRKQASAASGADVIALKLEAMATVSSSVQDAMKNMGVDASGLSDQLVSAGVSSDQMSKVSQDAFEKMLANCGGNIQTLAAEIQMYNATPIADKDGNITVDKTSLIDAQGNVYTWNGTQVVGKDGQVVVDTVSLLDAQGNVVTWNGTNLEYKGANADVDSQSVIDATKNIDDYNQAAPEDKHATTVIDVIANVINSITDAVTQNAEGGFRLNAAGGYRFHAGGAIATRAMPIDIVGEAGAEAIVPLTNKKYSQPFAQTISEQMGLGDGIAGLRAEVAALRAELGQTIRENAPVVSVTDRQQRIFNREYARS